MHSDGSFTPRVGLPYRTRKEELNGDFAKLEPYISSLRAVGAEPVVLSLGLADDHLRKIATTLDAALLTGSPADVDPSRFRAARHSASADPDPYRERTDCALIEHCFAEQKPLLAICYGVQSLNVYLGGSLVQDIPTEVSNPLSHSTASWKIFTRGIHKTHIDPASKLSRMDGATDEVRVNSSHHQSILEPGRDLRIISRAPDGVVEAVEWTGDNNWVLGVQWHPERMTRSDALSQSIFSELVQAARRVPADA